MKFLKQKLRRFGSSFGLVLLSAICVAAQSVSDESQTAPTTGSITGQVVTDTGQPISGAAVSVLPYGASQQGRTSISDALGNFRVNGLEPLAYFVSAFFSPYVTAPRDPDTTQAPYYRVGDSVRLQLIKGSAITGTVTSSGSEPIVGIGVLAHMIRDSKGQPSRYGVTYKGGSTDDRGIYRIYGLNAGTYVVSAGGGGVRFSPFGANAYNGDVPTFSPSSTRDTAAEVNLTAGGEASNVDIRYRGESGHIISGSAIDPAASASPFGFTIFLSPNGNGLSQARNSSYQAAGSRGFSFYGVADGDYDVMAQTYYPDGEVAISGPRRVKVVGADITGLEITVQTLGTITGHVALEESKAPECKGKRRPVLGETLITPWHNEKNKGKDQPQFQWSFGAPALPDKQGDFLLRNLSPGEYRFQTRPFAKYWYLQSISLRTSAAATTKVAVTNRPTDAARNWTTVKSGVRLSGLVITLAEGAASLKGQIKIPEGQKAPPRLLVYLVPAELDHVEDVLRFFSSLVDNDGSFALNNLPPGRYWALAKAAAENESGILSKLRLPDESEFRSKLRKEAELGKSETELKPCQNVTDYSLAIKFATPAK